MAGRRLTFAISADYERRTGGWVYDQALVAGLERRGWQIERLTLPAGFPRPDAEARTASAAAFAALADGTLLLVDQLCIGVLPDLAALHGSRLRLATIVHHPLALELDPATAESRAFAADERAGLAHAGLVIATSDATAVTLVRDYAVATALLVVAPPGTEPASVARGSGGPGLALLSVGALVPRKDHGLLLAALARLVDRDWRLNLVGNATRAADHVAALRAQIEALGLGERVAITGELDEPNLATLWDRSDLYVAASRHEGYGMALAEALAHGLPAVSTAAGAVADWLDPDAALIVPPGDEAELAAALARVLDEPETLARLRGGALAARVRLGGWEPTVGRVEAALLRLQAAGG